MLILILIFLSMVHEYAYFYEYIWKRVYSLHNVRKSATVYTRCATNHLKLPNVELSITRIVSNYSVKTRYCRIQHNLCQTETMAVTKNILKHHVFSFYLAFWVPNPNKSFALNFCSRHYARRCHFHNCTLHTKCDQKVSICRQPTSYSLCLLGRESHLKVDLCEMNLEPCIRCARALQRVQGERKLDPVEYIASESFALMQ